MTEAPRVTPVEALSLRARSLDIPNEPHPNKMPFSGVLTYIDEPSDSAPEGSRGNRVMITAEAAHKALDSLLGMAVDYEVDWAGHDPKQKIGVITASDIKEIGGRHAIVVSGFIYAADFPEEAKSIKANKANLGMSFEARDLWTTDPKADPVPIYECVFTGAAILLKDKAAYKTTSINAAAQSAQLSQEDFPMDENTKKELSEMLAAALKPVADAVAEHGKEIAKIQSEKIEAANHLAKVERHAAELEKVADHFDAAGIGGHPSLGHAKVLRDMATDLRANAARGVLPAIFDHFNAVAARDEAGQKIEEAVAKVTAEMNKKLDELKAAAEKTAAEHKDALAAAETKMADLKAQAEKNAEAPERKTVLTPMDQRWLAKAGVQPDDNGKIDIHTLDKALAPLRMSPEDRMQLKASLAQAKVID